MVWSKGEIGAGQQEPGSQPAVCSLIQEKVTLARPPRLTRSSSCCPRLGHWGICGTQQGREGTGSRITNNFWCDLTETLSSQTCPSTGLFHILLAQGWDVAEMLPSLMAMHRPGKQGPARPGPVALLPPETCGHSPVQPFSSTQLRTAHPGCHELLSGHCSLKTFALLFEKLGVSSF